MVRRSKEVNDFIQQNALRNPSHVPYLPDLASSDFILVGYIKQKLKEIEFKSLDVLKQWTIDEFSRLDFDFLLKVFHPREKRPQGHIFGNGYIHRG